VYEKNQEPPLQDGEVLELIEIILDSLLLHKFAASEMAELRGSS
jgi:hypothetical protein